MSALVLFVRELPARATAWWAAQTPASKLAFFIGGGVVLVLGFILG
jgi:hypothetical protein